MKEPKNMNSDANQKPWTHKIILKFIHGPEMTVASKDKETMGLLQE